MKVVTFRQTWSSNEVEEFTFHVDDELCAIEEEPISGSMGSVSTAHLEFELNLLPDGRGYLKGYDNNGRPHVLPAWWHEA